jgi:two-component system sensor histidine kinase/response regulator
MPLEEQTQADDIEILIVEDSPTQAEKLRYLTEGQGYRVRVAGNGRIALELLAQRRADLVLSDIVMPEMDGYALCRAIKAHPALRRIPVILLTTLADPKDIVQGLDCGADNFIRKPYDEDLLVRRVQHMLANRELRQKVDDGSGVEIFIGGQRHFISSERQQILDLLISTYEQAVRVNEELKLREQQIGELNSLLAQHAIELETANRELAGKNAELEQAGQAKLRFFAHMSHELRTPLNAVIGFSEILKEGLTGELNPEQQEYVGEIMRSGQHLLALINDTLDLARLEAHKMDLQPEMVDVRDLLQSCLPVVRDSAAMRHITLGLSIEDDVGNAWLDARKVRQIVFNLLSNAVKFTLDNGSVTLAASVTQTPPETAMLNISVQDTGIGIADEHISRLFRSFERVEDSATKGLEGTGLGLALVKQLAELHGGHVAVVSTVGTGSRFTVCLPYHSEPQR